MSSAFSRTLRSLEADGFGRMTWALTLALVLLAAWTAWFFLGTVAVYRVSDSARLEAASAAHVVEAPVAGRIVATDLVLGKEVEAGAVLAELEPEVQQQQLAEEESRSAALTPQIEGLRREASAERQALAQSLEAAVVALDEARAQLREAVAMANLAERDAERAAQLHARGLLTEAELQRANADADRRRAAAETLRLAVGRREREQKAAESDRRARIAGLEGELTRLEGQRAASSAAVGRLDHERNLRRIRAPVAGVIGEVAELRPGAFVEEGDALGAVVPTGRLRIVAHFLPQAALGRVRPGQRAHLRLEGFPWAQYGSVPATVSSVASEPRDGRVRVELALDTAPRTTIPLQHGLPGQVEVEVERASPATLALRVAGKLVAR